MSYIFLNQFSFENIDNSKQSNDIIQTFEEVAYLLRDLRKFDYELIFDTKLSQFKFNNKTIIDYLELISKEARILLLSKIQKSKPFCSDTFDEYFENENIVLGNCIIEDTNIEILENFLACAMFLNAPIVTPNICTKEIFLKDKVTIVCDKIEKELINYLLKDKTDREVILNKIENEIKNSSDNWQEWRENSLPLYKNVSMTNECFKEINKYSFTTDIATSIIDFIKNIDSYVNNQNKSIMNLNYKECCSNTNPESTPRLDKLKRELSVINCNDNKEVANWHTYIKKDFRLYFVLDEKSNKICFVKFTKKIS